MKHTIALILALTVAGAVTAARLETPPVAGPTDSPLRVASLELVGPADEDAGIDSEAEAEATLPDAVTFDAPLTTGGQGVEGLTIMQVLDGSPLFPPIEGLPAALWQGKACSSCHGWSRQDLCDQGNRYLGGLASALEKKHPLGGGFKSNLAAWAQNDCR